MKKKSNGWELNKVTNKYNFNKTSNNMFNPKNNDVSELVTAVSGGGGIKNNLDYIMIIDKRKNRVDNIKTNCNDNTNQNYQRKMIQIDVTKKLKNRI